MVLRYQDRYVWDHWMYDDGEDFHIFYLQAPRLTKNASERHLNASIGHATSKDLKNWNEIGTALQKSQPGSWDDVATWTGSVIRNPKTDEYFLFYTGVHKSNEGLVQAIGVATSPDLTTWKKFGERPIAQADPKYYECQENGARDTDFRDPWVFFDQRDNNWHMLITATSKTDKNIKTRGVVGHAISENLLDWKVLPPLAQSTGFGQVEVIQVIYEKDQYYAIFCCGIDFISDDLPGFTTGTFILPIDSPTGPFHFDQVKIFDAPNLYAGRVIKNRAGEFHLLGFKTAMRDSEAPCEITDPISISSFISQTFNKPIKER
jgi:beta-fructofuranosidase